MRRKAIADRVQALGSNLLFVRPGSSRQGHVHFGSGSMVTLKMEDADALREKSRYLANVLPELAECPEPIWQQKLEHFNCRHSSRVWERAQRKGGAGTLFHPGGGRQYRTRGSHWRRRPDQSLWRRSALNQTIRINQDNFVVVGVLEKKGQMGWMNQDDQIWSPSPRHSAADLAADNLTGLTIKVLDETHVEEALVEVEKILRRQHRLDRDQDNDFSIRNQSDVISTMQETNKTFGFLLAAIAGVSLLVGGIGIMNIMLVSVTRENPRDRHSQGDRRAPARAS